MDIKVFTIFPEMFPGPLATSLTGRALEKKMWSLEAVNLRDYTLDKHQSVDDTSYGGGPGMVFRPDVIDRAFSHYYEAKRPDALIYFSPRGAPLSQSRVKELAQTSTLGLLCGRFEGVDQRVIDAWDIEEVSIGDFILTGGELPAMVLIDACIRLLPGVIGSSDSLEEESFSKGLLEYPHYTRPSEWKGRKVPEALLSGHHEKIRAWRQNQAEEITRKRRPDLWAHYCKVFNARERADHE
jgi:tRNA (guanine37-N1)-methyltransferase